MGGSSSRRSADEDDLRAGDGGVIKRIPIEVKPRGRIGLRGAVTSLGKRHKSTPSLRSALSLDFESPEVEKIRREFEMYRLHKEQELSELTRREARLSAETTRMRSELPALQKTCRKLRQERDSALEAEHQALVRSAAFESDRDKIQRQFKLFRETKEGEIQALLRARRGLENKLSKLTSGSLDDGSDLSRFGIEASLGMATAGDWWTVLESEPSLGSTSQLHTSSLRGPELAHSTMPDDSAVPYTNVNKEDWHAAAASLAAASLTQHYSEASDLFHSNVITVYISAAADAVDMVEAFCKLADEPLSELCKHEARFLNLVHILCDDDLPERQRRDLMEARHRRIDTATVFLAFIEDKVDTDTEQEIHWGHLDNPGLRSTVFVFKNCLKKEKVAGTAALHKAVVESGSARLIEDSKSAAKAVERALEEVDAVVKIELGMDNAPEKDLAETVIEYEGPEVLCGGILWDPRHDLEQAQALAHAGCIEPRIHMLPCMERLTEHLAAPGPQPPLLVMGPPGGGKSSLLATWLAEQQRRQSNAIFLHHFVETTSAITADPAVMIRRFTARLLAYSSVAPVLTCDPIRLTDEFPRWLEKISAKTGSGIVLLLDSADRLASQKQLSWMLDPLPHDLRIILSVSPQTCPQAWLRWPTLTLEPWCSRDIRKLLTGHMGRCGKQLLPSLESRVLAHCSTPNTATPLYLTLLCTQLARLDDPAQVEQVFSSKNSKELYKVILSIVQESNTDQLFRKFLKQAMCLIYVSRLGLSEVELIATTENFAWEHWAPLRESLFDSHLLTSRSGLITFTHQQARDAVWEMYFTSDESEALTLSTTRTLLRDYFAKYQSPQTCTYRVADELCWLNMQLNDKQETLGSVWNLCIFLKLYSRGRCSEIVRYWVFAGEDNASMCNKYQGALKHMEGMVGQMGGVITLPRIADCYEALGRFLRDLGMLTEALTPLQRALEIRETALDPDHPSVAQTLHQVAGVHAQQSRFAAAEALYKQALEIFEGTFGKDHYLVAKELDALAVLYQKQGKHDLSEPIHRRALSIRRKTKAPRVTSSHMRSVDPIKRRTLALEDLTLGQDSAELAKSLNELGVLYYLQNNAELAESFFRRSLEMRESVFGEDNTHTAQSLNNLAALCHDAKRFEDARKLYERALAIRRKLHPVDHPSVSSVINHLANLYKKMGEFSRAEPLFRESIVIREAAFSPTHPAVATALVNLAVLYSQQGKHEEAEPLYERALTIYEGGLGSQHPRVAETLKNMALLKYERGDFEQAAALYKRATDIKENSDPSLGKLMAARRNSVPISDVSVPQSL